MNMDDRKGLIIVYTGDGKGKTTAALGAAFRASGRGMKTLMIQFLKEKGASAEQDMQPSPFRKHQNICLWKGLYS